MRRLMQLIFLSCVMMISTQCDREHNLDVVPPTPPPTVDPPKEDDPTHEEEPPKEDDLPQETWELSYDDYHSLRTALPEYLNMIRNVSITRYGDRLSIKGIFPEYPDAWVRCTVRNDSVFIKKRVELGMDENGSKVYFLWGFAYYHWYVGITYRETIYFDPEGNGRAAFELTNDGCEMRPANVPEYKSVAFWYSRSRESFYYDKGSHLEFPDDQWGSGFPDTGFMVNMKFRKVSDATD